MDERFYPPDQAKPALKKACLGCDTLMLCLSTAAALRREGDETLKRAHGIRGNLAVKLADGDPLPYEHDAPETYTETAEAYAAGCDKSAGEIETRVINITASCPGTILVRRRGTPSWQGCGLSYTGQRAMLSEELEHLRPEIVESAHQEAPQE